MKIVAGIFGLAVILSIGAFFLFANSNTASVIQTSDTNPPSAIRYEIDAARSSFFVKASRGGIAFFKGHDHRIAVRDFSGTAELTLDAITPASLSLTIKSASLEETNDGYTPQQKGIINKELEEIVLETAKYPEITFKSTDVNGFWKDGKYELNIGGNITLHGVTKHIVIPAIVSLEDDVLRAKGEFDIERSKFNVKAPSAFHGTVRVKNKLKFTFDIVGKRG